MNKVKQILLMAKIIAFLKREWANYVYFINSERKSYRKKKGGTWYKVRDYEDVGYAGSPMSFWTQIPPEEKEGIIVIEKKEEYKN